MGDSGNEIRLELLQPPLLRPIAKRVDGPVRKAHSGDREPEVLFRSGRSVAAGTVDAAGALNGDPLRE